MRLEAVWLSVSVLVFGVVGAVWGLLRPRYTLNVLEGGTVEVAEQSASSREFGAFCSYLGTVAVFAAVVVVLCLWIFGRFYPDMSWARAVRWFRGVAPVLLLANGVLGVVMFSQCVELVSRWRWPIPDAESLHPGDSFDVVVEVSGLHGLIVAGLVTTVLCWLRLISTTSSVVNKAKKRKKARKKRRASSAKHQPYKPQGGGGGQCTALVPQVSTLMLWSPSRRSWTALTMLWLSWWWVRPRLMGAT